MQYPIQVRSPRIPTLLGLSALLSSSRGLGRLELDCARASMFSTGEVAPDRPATELASLAASLNTP